MALCSSLSPAANAGVPLSIWTWSKVVHSLAERAGLATRPYGGLPGPQTSGYMVLRQVQKKVTWNRPGLLECSCGNALGTLPRDTYTADDYWLLDLIRRKALGVPTSPYADLNLFERHVAEAPLHSLLSLVRFVGKNRILTKWSKKPTFARQILREAASALAEWPTNFESFLKTLAP